MRLGQVNCVRLSEAVVTAALAQRDWPALKAHLDEIGFDGVVLEDLLGHLRRASGLIFRYPDAKREESRGVLLTSLLGYVEAALGESGAARVAEEIALLLQVERGYRSLLGMVSSADISAFPAEVRAGACLRWAFVAFADLMRRHDEALHGLKELKIPGEVFVTDGDGNPVSLDAGVNSVVNALSTTLVMEAHKNGWQDSAGTVILPTLPAVEDDVVVKAGSIQALAMFWGRWRRTEERRRFIGGRFEELTAPKLPDWASGDVQLVTTYVPDDSEFFDHAANERALDRLGQQFMQMMVETNVREKVSGIANAVPLLPTGIVNLQEVHAAAALSDVLHYEITADVEPPAGLRWIEWLRGFAVLHELASNAQVARPGVDGFRSVFTRDGLLDVLGRCGLSRDSAARFLERTTFKVSSEDLFDAPLVQMQDGTLLLFGPALLHVNLTQVVLSVLANLREPLSRKGSALEAAVRGLLKDQGLHARGFKVTRGGEVYEYDVVLEWSEWIFVFECKNRSLSSNRPVNAYYFDVGMRAAVEQVQRLAGALREYPDILAEQMQVDVAGKTIVPCVLNSLPYSREGDIEGVYCTDWSGLDRFFEGRHVSLNVPYEVRKGMRVVHRVPVVRLWEGVRPGPKDLLRQLQAPVQLKWVRASTAQRARAFPIGPAHLVAATEFVRTEWDLESVARAYGVSAARIQEQIATVDKEVRAAKARMNRGGEGTRRKKLRRVAKRARKGK